MAATFTILLLTSFIVHSLSHAIVAERAGILGNRVVLLLLGSRTRLARDPEDPNVDARVAMAGPIASFSLCAFFTAGFLTGVAPIATGLLAVANLGLVMLELCPALPLDGGRILRSRLWRANGSRCRSTSRKFAECPEAYGIPPRRESSPLAPPAPAWRLGRG